jgi:hypothetical protein
MYETRKRGDVWRWWRLDEAGRQVAKGSGYDTPEGAQQDAALRGITAPVTNN